MAGIVPNIFPTPKILPQISTSSLPRQWCRNFHLAQFNSHRRRLSKSHRVAGTNTFRILVPTVLCCLFCWFECCKRRKYTVPTRCSSISVCTTINTRCIWNSFNFYTWRKNRLYLKVSEGVFSLRFFVPSTRSNDNCTKSIYVDVFLYRLHSVDTRHTGVFACSVDNLFCFLATLTSKTIHSLNAEIFFKNYNSLLIIKQ